MAMYPQMGILFERLHKRAYPIYRSAGDGDEVPTIIVWDNHSRDNILFKIKQSESPNRMDVFVDGEKVQSKLAHEGVMEFANKFFKDPKEAIEGTIENNSLPSVPKSSFDRSPASSLKSMATTVSVPEQPTSRKVKRRNLDFDDEEM